MKKVGKMMGQKFKSVFKNKKKEDLSGALFQEDGGKFDLKQHIKRFKWVYSGVVSVMVLLAGYSYWVKAQVTNYVNHSKFVSQNNEVTELNDFVGGESPVADIKRGLFAVSLFNPKYASKEYYIQKEVGVVGFAYEENGKKVDFGNMIDDKYAPLDVKVIPKEDYETQGSDYKVVTDKKYTKVENKEELQRYLNAIGIPYEDGKTYYKFVSGTYVEKYAITVDK